MIYMILSMPVVARENHSITFYITFKKQNIFFLKKKQINLNQLVGVNGQVKACSAQPTPCARFTSTRTGGTSEKIL